mgnify:CR=1 FL=1
MQYSEKVMDHFMNPRNVGEIEDASGVGQVGNAKCGDIMKMYLKVEGGIITDVKMIGGCSGNTQGVARLVEGMDAKEVVNRLKGLNCNGRGTSCPDQLAIAITKAIED